MTEFDMSEVTKLSYDLTKGTAALVPALGVVIEASAQAIQDDMRSAAKGHARFPAFPAAITHDVRGLAAEIGPDKNRRAGALGNILYFGTATNGPVLELPSAALARERPKFEAAVATVATGVLSRALK